MHLPDNTLLSGGKYRILRFISSGGFGCTYEAEHVLLEKRVAIKEFFVKDFCNRDETTAHITVGTQSKKGLVEKLRRKFIDEARSLSQLHHPGIVSVSDVFEENGTAYFVMDYIEGRSLGDIVNQEGPLPEERAVRYIRQVAEALQYVHDNNRLHLDIKPGNIMIDENDNPVLIDFGASKQYDELDGENTSTLMGKTPGYAPPEQMSNSVVKFLPATDIYALGATLYKLLTGNTPPDAFLRISGLEELQALPPAVSASVQEATTSAMAIKSTKRPQTLRAFIKMFDSPVAFFPISSAINIDETTILTREGIKEIPKVQTNLQKGNDKGRNEPASVQEQSGSVRMGLCLWMISIGFMVALFIALFILRPISLKEKSLILWEGESTTLSVTPKHKKIDWKSEDTAIATVDQLGRVKGIAAGNTTIVAQYNGRSSKCFVLVKQNDNWITMSTETARNNYNLGFEAENAGDYNTAFDYYVEAFQGGVDLAAVKIAYAYAYGQGVAKNIELAYNFINRALYNFKEKHLIYPLTPDYGYDNVLNAKGEICIIDNNWETANEIYEQLMVTHSDDPVMVDSKFFQEIRKHRENKVTQ